MTREDLPKGPLNIVPLSWKQNNHVQYAYEKNFAARIWRFRNLPGYAFMHRWAQKQIDLHCGDSLDGISARVYMDTVLEQEGAELQTWAKKYIAQSLWTDYAKTPRDGPHPRRVDGLVRHTGKAYGDSVQSGDEQGGNQKLV